MTDGSTNRRIFTLFRNWKKNGKIQKLFKGFIGVCRVCRGLVFFGIFLNSRTWQRWCISSEVPMTSWFLTTGSNPEITPKKIPRFNLPRRENVSKKHFGRTKSHEHKIRVSHKESTGNMAIYTKNQCFSRMASHLKLLGVANDISNINGFWKPIFPR